jgi:PAS domain S-box-containing protein
MDLQGRFQRLSPAWTRTLGYSQEYLLTCQYTDLVHPSDVVDTKNLLTHLQHDKASTIQLTNRYRCQNGSYQTLAWEITYTTESETLYAVAMRVIVNTAYCQEVERYRRLFENSPMGILILDKQGYPLLVNPAVEKIFGYSVQEITQMPFTALTHPDDIQEI